MTEKKELKPKEKYLTVQIQLGSLKIRWNAFKIKDEDKVENGPAFKGNGIAIWINEKMEKQPNTVSEEFV